MMDRAAEARVRLLEAARTLLAEDGGHGFTTRRVAAGAAMSHSMCHYHFATKSDLLIALIDHSQGDWTQPLEDLLESPGSASERAARIISWMSEPATLEVMRVHQALFGFALYDPGVRARLAEEYARWRSSFVKLFTDLAEERELGDFDSEGVGGAFAAAADGLVEQQSLDPDIDSQRFLSALFDRLVNVEGQSSRSR